MKITVISTILIALILLQTQSQIRKADNDMFSRTPKTILQEADCYDGNVAIDV